MIRRLLVPAATVSLSFAPAAPAAEIATGNTCYADPGIRKDTVTWSGTGFTPGAMFQAALDDAALEGASGTVDAAGAAGGSFAAPSLNEAIAPGTLQHTFTLGVTDGVNAPTTTFTVSKLRASFRPTRGRPRTLRVRFTVNGFALATAPTAARPPIYVHYVRPNGRLRRTVKLGTSQGACGSLTTARRRLFPFTPSRGTWTLQFDTATKYRRPVASSRFLFYRIPVRVR